MILAWAVLEKAQWKILALPDEEEEYENSTRLYARLRIDSCQLLLLLLVFPSAETQFSFFSIYADLVYMYTIQNLRLRNAS
jgi:hypothetical protein